MPLEHVFQAMYSFCAFHAIFTSTANISGTNDILGKLSFKSSPLLSFTVTIATAHALHTKVIWGYVKFSPFFSLWLLVSHIVVNVLYASNIYVWPFSRGQIYLGLHVSIKVFHTFIMLWFTEIGATFQKLHFQCVLTYS